MQSEALTLTCPRPFPMVEPGDDLAALLIESLQHANIVLRDKDVLVLAQKIVSKAEGRYVSLNTVNPSARAVELGAAIDKDPRMVELILSESKEIVKHRNGVLIVEHRLGFVMANAGIDQSNIDHPPGDERALLLPLDPDASCMRLKQQLDEFFDADIGVVINDSFGRPWRQGVTGVALGAAGLPALLSLIGEPDLFGRAMRVSEIAVADEIAAAASLVMGQTDAAKPVVHIRGLQWDAAARPAADLLRPKQQDLFR